jgi:hypothetical protein
MRPALFDGLELNGFGQDCTSASILASQGSVQRGHDLGAVADRGDRWGREAEKATIDPLESGNMVES